MTDLEAKISSEFANGDPTVQGAATPAQPLAIRLSYKRLAFMVTALLLIGGGVITYFASTTVKAPEAPVISTVQPTVTDVQAAAVEAPQPPTPPKNNGATVKATATPVSQVVTNVTPTPEPVRPYYPPQPQGQLTNLIDSVLDTVNTVVDTTISIAL